MSFEYFISRRLLKSEVQGKKVSTAIVRISVISIALAVVVNLLTIAISTGFRNEVSEKVTGFGSHLFLMTASDGTVYESEPILKNQSFLQELDKMDELKGLFPVAYKPVLFQSEKFEATVALNSGKDTSLTKQEIQGCIIKGVTSDYDFSFFEEHLKDGRLPNFPKDSTSYELLISKNLAKNLNYHVGDTIKAFFVRSKPVLKLFQVVGIYETGLEEHDKKFAIGDLRIAQELNDWGIKARIDIDDTTYQEKGFEDLFILRVNAQGGRGNIRYDWGQGYERYGARTYGAFKDTSYQVVVSDYWMNIDGKSEVTTIPDTAFIDIKVKGNANTTNDFEVDDFGNLVRHYTSIDGTSFYIKASQKEVHFTIREGKGSFENYIGGFEITVNDWDILDQTQAKVKKIVANLPTEHNEHIKVTSIKDNESDIFVWLGFLDLNVWIVLFLMIVIGIINMGSALLVLIITRTNFIGILKSLGTSNWSVRKIFLHQAAFLILRGMVFGNVIGVGLCLAQQYFHIIPLNPEVYYLSTVPIELNFIPWLLLNIGTLVVCVAALIIPSMVITKISPSKAVKFN